MVATPQNDHAVLDGASPAQEPRRLIVAIEGLDGSGKSTTVKLLAERLGAVVIRNPPETLASQRPEADGLEPEARRAWYLNANRVAMDQALASTARPVVLDRSIASTLCFGTAERGEVATRADLPLGFPMPDLIILLAVPESVRRERHRRRRGTVTDEEERLVADDAFRTRVLDGYANLCSAQVDASGPPESVVLGILTVIEDLSAAPD